MAILIVDPQGLRNQFFDQHFLVLVHQAASVSQTSPLGEVQEGDKEQQGVLPQAVTAARNLLEVVPVGGEEEGGRGEAEVQGGPQGGAEEVLLLGPALRRSGRGRSWASGRGRRPPFWGSGSTPPGTPRLASSLESCAHQRRCHARN